MAQYNDYYTVPRPQLPLFDTSKPPSNIESFLGQSFVTLARYFESMHRNQLAVNKASRLRDLIEFKTAIDTYYQDIARRGLPKPGEVDYQDEFAAFFDPRAANIRASTREEHLPWVDIELATIKKEALLKMADFRALHLDTFTKDTIRRRANELIQLVAGNPHATTQVIRKFTIDVEESDLDIATKTKILASFGREVAKLQVRGLQEERTANALPPDIYRVESDNQGRAVAGNIGYANDEMPGVSPDHVKKLAQAVTHAGSDLHAVLDPEGGYELEDDYNEPLDQVRDLEGRADTAERMAELGGDLKNPKDESELMAFQLGALRRDVGPQGDINVLQNLTQAEISAEMVTGTKLGLARRQRTTMAAMRSFYEHAARIADGDAKTLNELIDLGVAGVAGVVIRTLPAQAQAEMIQKMTEGRFRPETIDDVIDSLPASDHKNRLRLLAKTRGRQREDLMKSIERSGKAGILLPDAVKSILKMVPLDYEQGWRATAHKWQQDDITRKNAAQEATNSRILNEAAKEIISRPGVYQNVHDLITALDPRDAAEIYKNADLQKQLLKMMRGGHAPVTEARAAKFLQMSPHELEDAYNAGLVLPHNFGAADWKEVQKRLAVARGGLEPGEVNMLDTYIGQIAKGRGLDPDQVAALTLPANNHAQTTLLDFINGNPDPGQRSKQTMRAAYIGVLKAMDETVDYDDMETNVPELTQAIRGAMVSVEGKPNPSESLVEQAFQARFVDRSWPDWAVVMPNSAKESRKIATDILKANQLKPTEFLIEAVAEANFLQDRVGRNRIIGQAILRNRAGGPDAGSPRGSEIQPALPVKGEELQPGFKERRDELIKSIGGQELDPDFWPELEEEEEEPLVTVGPFEIYSGIGPQKPLVPTIPDLPDPIGDAARAVHRQFVADSRRRGEVALQQGVSVPLDGIWRPVTSLTLEEAQEVFDSREFGKLPYITRDAVLAYIAMWKERQQVEGE